MPDSDRTLKRCTFDPAATGPLTGVAASDFPRLMAGNMLSLQLADFGASDRMA